MVGWYHMIEDYGHTGSRDVFIKKGRRAVELGRFCTPLPQYLTRNLRQYDTIPRWRVKPLKGHSL
jgi:hypothetical protein